MEQGTEMDIFQDVDIPDLDHMLDVEDTFLDQYIQDLTGVEEAATGPDHLIGLLQDGSPPLEQPLPPAPVYPAPEVPRQVVTTGGTAALFLSPSSSTIPAVYNAPRNQAGASYSFSDQDSGAQGNGDSFNLGGVSSGGNWSQPNGGGQVPQAAGGVQKQRRRRVRNTQQQVQNKLAQQRYREKRKNKFNDLQDSVTKLTAQVEKLSELESDKALLKGENESLAILVAQQRERIAQLQADVQRLQLVDSPTAGRCPPQEVTSESCPGPDQQDPCCKTTVEPGTKGDHVDVEKEEARTEVKDELAMFKDVEQRLKKKLEYLRQLIDQHAINLSVDAAGAHLQPAALSELSRGIKEVCTLAVCHTRQLTLKVVQEKFQTVDEATKITCPVARERFQTTARQLHLTPEQEAQLLDVRGKMLARLKQTYEERQKLNMELVGLMLPHRSQTGEFIDTSAESKIALLSRTGVFPCVAQNLEMHQKLEDIRRNIRKELGIHACANYQFATRILSPAQACVGLVTMDPVPLDVLGLGNFVLASKQKREAELVEERVGDKMEEVLTL